MRKILFIDRDGTLICEPKDNQIDSMDKFALVPDVIPSLLQLKNAGFSFVMVSNQDGLGTEGYPQEKYAFIQNFLLQLLDSQGIKFESIRICPHKIEECCACRKPRVDLILDYLVEQKIDRNHSYVIGDRQTDLEFAKNMGIKGFLVDSGWQAIVEKILFTDRRAEIFRKTNETEIQGLISLDTQEKSFINTGIGFFDHLLEQLAKHAGFKLDLHVLGDLSVDDHHTIEDTALALGDAIKKALGDKHGIARYAYMLPMDEALVQIALDLSGRPYLVFSGKFERESIGNFSTELVSHFFRSFSESLKATLHIKVEGENTHHMIEAIFKGVGRTLRQAIKRIDNDIPSTKGVL